MSDTGYTCKHCKKPFSNERVFMRHECTQMVRAKEIQTIEGRRAYELYKTWLQHQKRKAPPVETFCTSSYYTSFMKFSKWLSETGIPDPNKYVELMSGQKIAPALWGRSEAYQIYLDYVDKKSDPFEQVSISVDTIQALAEGLEIPTGEVFGVFKVGEFLELIHQRRISPWLLFCSKKFREWVKTLDEHDRNLLMRGIGVDYWSMKLEANNDKVKQIIEIADALGI